MKKKIKLLVDMLGQVKGTVLEVDSADADLLVTAKKAELVVEQKGAEGGEDDPQAAISTLLENFKKSLGQIVTEAGKELSTQAKKVGSKVKSAINGGTARNDDEEEFGYKGLGDFAMEVKAFNNTAKTADPERLKGYVEKTAEAVKAVTGMNEGAADEGAILVPTQISQTIYERAFPDNSLAAGCDVYNLTGNAIVFPGLADDSRATGSRWGGVRGHWLGEGGQHQGSKPKFTDMRLRLHKLGVLVYVTDELLSDSAVALDQFLSRKAGDEIQFMTSDAIINGNGANKPLGILNSPGLISVTRTTASKIKFEDISNMWNRLWSPFRSQAAWYVNQEVEPQLDQLTFAVKNVAGTENVGGWPLYIPPGGLNSSPYGLLKGRPVIPTEWNPALGAAGDILLGTMNQYLLGTKQGVQSSMSIHLRFDYDETAFKFVYRVDGQPWWNKPVTPYKGTTTYSPFVTLAS